MNDNLYPVLSAKLGIKRDMNTKPIGEHVQPKTNNGTRKPTDSKFAQNRPAMRGITLKKCGLIGPCIEP